jgi:uncharacterized membrane protein
MPGMGEYGVAGGQSSGLAGGNQGNLFADMTHSVMNSLSDLANAIVALPPWMLLVILVAFIFGGLLVFRRV